MMFKPRETREKRRYVPWDTVLEEFVRPRGFALLTELREYVKEKYGKPSLYYSEVLQVVQRREDYDLMVVEGLDGRKRACVVYLPWLKKLEAEQLV